MAPIRVGLIGLSSNAATSWASNAHFPYLTASNGKYEIKALCNSSVEAAQKAVTAYKLPSSTKTYGDPQDLANDPDVDLVVCSVRVDNHYKTTKPSIEAGKNVFVEWPLASNIEDVTELVALAKEKGVKTMVALEGRVSPIYLKVKALLQENRIGKVLNSSVVASGGTKARDSVNEGIRYFLERCVGGNFHTIIMGHLLDSIHSALGPFANTSSTLSLTRPKIDLLSPSGEVTGTATSDTPDHIVYTGRLSHWNNAPVSIILRRGPPFKDTPGFVWSIQGETGEIRVESVSPSFQAYDLGSQVLLENYESGEVEKVDWENKESPWKLPARDIAALYEAFAGEEKGVYPDFEEAAGIHQELDAMWKHWDVERGL